MQESPLLISSLIEHVSKYHGQREIVSLLVEGGIDRRNWAAIGKGCKQLANALIKDLGVKPGDRVGTLAWNCESRSRACPLRVVHCRVTLLQLTVTWRCTMRLRAWVLSCTRSIRASSPVCLVQSVTAPW